MAGRVLSAANEKQLKAALEAIGAVLSALAEDAADPKPTKAKAKEAATPASLQEARNAGDWFEAKIHSEFTEIADEMFGNGYLTRDERIALSGAIGGALDAFRASLEASTPDLYKRDPYTPTDMAAMMPGMMEAAIDNEFIPLTEASAVDIVEFVPLSHSIA